MAWLNIHLAQAQQPLLERLDPGTRTALVAMLVVIALVGVGLVVAIMFGGRWARRAGGTLREPSEAPPFRRQRRRMSQDEQPEEAPPQTPAAHQPNTGDTLCDARSPDDTHS